MKDKSPGWIKQQLLTLGSTALLSIMVKPKAGPHDGLASSSSGRLSASAEVDPPEPQAATPKLEERAP